ncbi:MAG TPA: 3'-5' exonuclease [Bacteroidales bacterium]|nr:3'-5' exonuclease [Bacteroidales bacterium]
MELNLKNPLIFLDLETTGLNIVSDRIVEITILKVFPGGKEEVKTYRVNPEMPIDPKATAVHGITDEDVKDCPTFKELAQTLVNEFEGCDFAGFNSNKFDFPMLAEEFLRANVDFDLKKRKFVDVQVIFHKMEQRTLSAAYKLYCNKELVDAHSSKADTYATYEVLQAQLDKYQGKKFVDAAGNTSEPITNDIDFLSKFSAHNSNVDFIGRIIYNEKGVEVFNFGKYKGMPVVDVLKKDPSYYSWMMNGDFPQYTKNVLTKIKLREFQK